MRAVTRRPAAVGLLVVVGLVVGAAPAVAGGYGSVDCRRRPGDPRCVVTVGTPGLGGAAGAGGAGVCRDGAGRVVACYVEGAGWFGGDGCYYRPAQGAVLAAAVAVGGAPAPPGAWYEGVCGYPPVAGLTRLRVFGTPPGPALLAVRAVRALRLPAPPVRVSPGPPAAQVVFLPMWVWLDAAWWSASRSATASVPGMAVTATARPVRLVLSSGTGPLVTCTGPGTWWRPGVDAGAGSPTCGHTFTRPGVYRLQATVSWDVSWSGGGVAGAVAGVTSTTSLQVAVVEAHAVNVGGTR